jgi:aconitate hydratase
VASLAEANAELLCADPEVEANPEEYFDRVIEIDLSTLKPHLVGPHTPDLARDVTEMSAEAAAEGYPVNVSSALIGSCTNSSYEDMSRAASLARQATSAGLKAKIPFYVTPGSDTVQATIKRDGQMAALEEVGALVLANACGPCIGQWKREDLEAGITNSIVTSFNRNFRKRADGRAETLAFIGSPEMVTAIALSGRLDFNPYTDTIEGVKLDPPTGAELPNGDFETDLTGFVPPAADGSGVNVVVAPESKRLELLTPFVPWNGEDYSDLPVLLKAYGKCTTDHISQAGPWLRFRGHLDNISDNMFIGAINAFTHDKGGNAGEGKDQLDGATKSFPAVARNYKANGLGWVVFGDENYGEGSSREHAAMEPRHLGAKAVIVRSFARIHETNLKKQAVLPLTFVDPADYDRVQEDDRVALSGITELAPGSTLQLTLTHGDGSTDAFEVAHTLNEEQIDWFKAGSALNKIRSEAGVS